MGKHRLRQQINFKENLSATMNIVIKYIKVAQSFVIVYVYRLEK